MADLCLIGNGFDLYHGLPCEYYYFGCYLIKYHPDFYSELGKMYGFKVMMRFPISDDSEWAVEYQLFWRYFEERLGQLDPLWMEDSLIDDLGLEYPDDAVDIEIPETINADTIKQYFTEWVSDTLDTDLEMKIIKQKLGKKKLEFPQDAYFVNFNYTSILEEIYQVPEKQVFHIHGKADEGIELIVGHGNKDSIHELEEKIEHMESETYYLSSQAERNRLNEYEAEKIILKNLQKDTDGLVWCLRNTLKDKQFKNIYIYGLSCGPVDMPYIKCLRKLYPDAIWHFSFFNDSEKENREKLSKKLKLKKSEVEYFNLKNDNADKIKQDIIDNLKIEEYRKI